jgi:hypothetical protein
MESNRRVRRSWVPTIRRTIGEASVTAVGVPGPSRGAHGIAAEHVRVPRTQERFIYDNLLVYFFHKM